MDARQMIATHPHILDPWISNSDEVFAVFGPTAA